MKNYIVLSLLFLLLLNSCASVLYQPVTSINNVSLEHLNEGRALYVNKCSGCHSLKSPLKYSEKDWTKNLDEMQIKAKISDAQKELIYQYLINAPKEVKKV